MAYRIQFRRDTTANWTTINPILLQGEFAYSLDTGFAKIGDGTSTWTQLAYFGGTGPTGEIGPTGAYGTVSDVPPGSSAAAGSTGQLALDSDYLYVCIGTDTWKRTQLTSW